MKKLKISLIVFLALLAGFSFYSCQKDDFTEEDAILLEEDLETNVQYSVSVVDAGTVKVLKSTKSVNSLDSVIITITQDGTTTRKVANDNGIAVFPGLKRGTVAVIIECTGYATVSYIAAIGADDDDDYNASTLIPMIPTTGSTAVISGQVTYESDLTNKSKEIVPGGTIVQAIAISSSATLEAIDNTIIQSIAYDDLVLQSTTDEDGNYQITVPATADGLTYEVFVSEFQADQSLLMNTVNGSEVTGVQTISTSFGSNLSSFSDVPDVSPVYATISDPDYDGPTLASAEAVIASDDGIESINVTSCGDYYEDPGYPYYYEIEVGTSSDISSGGSLATAQVYVENGRIIAIDIEDKGSDYKREEEYTLSYIQDNIEAQVTSVDANGTITGFLVSSNGSFLTKELSVTISSSSGSGVNITVSGFSSNSDGTWQISGLILSSGGTNYAVGDEITLELDENIDEEASFETNFETGSVVAITIEDPGDGYIDGKVYVELTGGGGSGATAEANVEGGKIDYIIVTDAGSGYTSTPTVNIISKATTQTPEVYVSVSDEGLVEAILDTDESGITTDNPVGSGYLTAPTITLTPQVSGTGAGAEAKAVVSDGEIVEIVITSQGSGYTGKNYYSDVTSDELKPEVDVIGTSGSISRNIYLGTGKRSIEE